MPEQLKTAAHVAFMVGDLDEELAGQKVAFILHDGAPVELMQEG
jgi:hypothetical protein